MKIVLRGQSNCVNLGYGSTPQQTILNVRKERYDRKNRFASEIQRYLCMFLNIFRTLIISKKGSNENPSEGTARSPMESSRQLQSWIIHRDQDDQTWPQSNPDISPAFQHCGSRSITHYLIFKMKVVQI